MTSADHLRQAVTVLLVAGLLVLAPALASARFTDGTGATVQVGTASVGTVSSVTGEYGCWNQGSSLERLEVTVTGFTGGATSGATRYSYTILRAGKVVGTPVTTSARNVSLSTGDVEEDKIATNWTLQVTAVLGSWTSAPWTTTLPCPEKGSAPHNTIK